MRKGRPWTPLLSLLPLLLLAHLSYSIILTGGPGSYARYPKWALSFENTLTLEIKTKQYNGLIFYTDDGGVDGNFYSISIVDGKIQLDFRLGVSSDDFGVRREVNSMRISEIRVDDDRWHALSLFQSWENVKLSLDNKLNFTTINQRSFTFGNMVKNSDVYIGGVPEDLHLLSSMSSPLRRYSSHIAANIRNLVYRLYPQGITSPSLLDAHGVRHNDDDYCRATAVAGRDAFACQNGGHCYSSNEGAQCDCTHTAFEGRQCESAKPDSELHFNGQEWAGYDVTGNQAGPIRSNHENVTLHFKTVHGSALLFYAGDENNYLHIGIDDGAVMATSKFDGTDSRLVRVFNLYPSARFDDDAWHSVVVERTLQMLTETVAAVHMELSVDGRKEKIDQMAGGIRWISHAFAYIGAVPKDFPHTAPVTTTPFRGCMKTALYRSSAVVVPFVHLADRGFGHSLMRTGGELSFSCGSPSSPPDVLSFHRPSLDSFLSLPKWNAMNSGSLSFHLRTLDGDGLVLFHGSGDDYVAFELVDGHLFLVLNLGSGVVRLQTTSNRMSDGEGGWHSVAMERQGRSGHVVVDSLKTEFSTPGVSANLIVDEPVFIGGVPRDPEMKLPSAVWSIGLGKGFTGCIKNVRFNGITNKIAKAFEEQNTTGISLGCVASSRVVDHCASTPCANFGHCHNSFTSFRCDCAHTNMDGATCGQEPLPIELEGESPILLTLPRPMATEAESVEMRFRTSSPHGVLLSTRSISNSTSRLQIALVNGQLQLDMTMGKYNHTFKWGTKLADRQMHTIRVKRRGEKLMLYLDGKWESVYFLPNKGNRLVLEMDEIAAGHTLMRGEGADREPFMGQLYSAIINDYDLLEKAKREGRMGSVHSPVADKESKKSKHLSLSFSNASGYAVLPESLSTSLHGSFRISFKFQTLTRHSLLLASLPSDTKKDSLTLEIFNGRIRYTYRVAGADLFVVSPILPHDKHLSDMRWHSLLLYQDAQSYEHVLMVDNTTTLLAVPHRTRARLQGAVAIASIPDSMSSAPVRLSELPSYRGCLSSLRLNDEVIDVLEQATEKKDVAKGCTAKKRPKSPPVKEGPIARCSPTACSNGGRCIQQWSSIRCDCALTAHSGSRCQQSGTTYDFPSTPSAIYLEYSEAGRPSTTKDLVVLAFKTRQPSGILLSVQCQAAMDFFSVYIDNGQVNVKWNLGARPHHMVMHQKRVDDGKWHVVRLLRAEENVTVAMDGEVHAKYTPGEGHGGLVTLNMQWRIFIGAAPDARHVEGGREGRRRRGSSSLPLFDPFHGSIAGVNFNGHLLLDQLAAGDSSLHVVGDPRQSFVASTPAPKERVMDDYMESSHALIESIGAACISVEESRSCYVENDDTGFFTPVLSSLPAHTASSSVPRRTLSTSTAAPSTPPTTGKTSTTSTTPAPTTTTTTMTTTTTSSFVFLDQFEGSGLPDGSSAKDEVTQLVLELQQTPATTPPTPPTPVTVLPRPYDSVLEAIRANPEYVESQLDESGGSVWQEAETVAEERKERTRTRKPTTTSTSTTSSSTTTTSTTTVATTTKRRKTTTGAPPPRSTHGGFTVPPVRQTTPMGSLITTTMKTMEGQQDFPRTMLISIFSLSVILVIAIVVFCVFRCRQSPPPGDHYPMVVNGKTASGYTPISAELSPPMPSHHHDPASQPLIAQPRMGQVNGYQPLKGANGLPPSNGNGYHANGNGIIKNGNGAGPGKKKDFKEWYV